MITKLWNRNYVLLLGIAFCSGVTAQLISTAIAPYMTYGLGMSTAITGVLSSIYTIVSSFGRLIAGNLVDRFGRRKFIFVGFICFGVGCYFFGAVTTVSLLILFRVMQGLGFAISSAASSASVADNVPPERLGSGLGYVSVVNALTQIIGPLVCTALIGWFGYQIPFTFSMFACAAACIIGLFTTDVFQKNRAETQAAPSNRSGISAIIEKKALMPAVFQFFISLSFSTYMVWGYNLTVERGYGDIQYLGGVLNFTGMFFALAAVGMILARLVIARVVDQVDEFTVCIPACAIGTVSFIVLYFETSPVVFQLSGVLYGVCLGIIQPTMNTVALRSVAADRRGAAVATFMLGFDGGIGIGATLWGVVISGLGYNGMIALAGMIMGLTTLAFVVARFVRASAEKS